MTTRTISAGAMLVLIDALDKADAGMHAMPPEVRATFKQWPEVAGHIDGVRKALLRFSAQDVSVETIAADAVAGGHAPTIMMVAE